MAGKIKAGVGVSIENRILREKYTILHKAGQNPMVQLRTCLGMCTRCLPRATVGVAALLHQCSQRAVARGVGEGRWSIGG